VLEILEAASLEMAEAADWYEERVVGLGDRFLAEARDAFDLIRRHPALGSPWLLKGIPPGIRHVPLRSFPYSVVYVLDPFLVVVAVTCASQEPTYWIDRLDDIEQG
jgi:hypothetical protein